jgi:hypothetical protein
LKQTVPVKRIPLLTIEKIILYSYPPDRLVFKSSDRQRNCPHLDSISPICFNHRPRKLSVYEHHTPVDTIWRKTSARDLSVICSNDACVRTIITWSRSIGSCSTPRIAVWEWPELVSSSPRRIKQLTYIVCEKVWE